MLPSRKQGQGACHNSNRWDLKSGRQNSEEHTLSAYRFAASACCCCASLRKGMRARVEMCSDGKCDANKTFLPDTIKLCKELCLCDTVTTIAITLIRGTGSLRHF